MNGPEHYNEAQRLLALSQDELENYAKARVGSTDEAAHLTQSQWAATRAQVHATLALVAATMNAADVVHWEDSREGSRGTGPRDLYPGEGMIWSEVL